MAGDGGGLDGDHRAEFRRQGEQLGAARGVFVAARDWPQALWDLRTRHGFRIVAAEDAPGAVDVGTLSPAPRTVVVFGAEAAGVSKAILEGADAVARVPMSTRGGTLADDPPSLNVAVASAVMLDRLCAR